MSAADHKQVLTIAGRWRQAQQASGLDKALSRRDQSLAMLMFYAGFSAALEANLEIAELTEKDGVHVLQALMLEVKQVEGMAQRLGADITPS